MRQGCRSSGGHPADEGRGGAMALRAHESLVHDLHDQVVVAPTEKRQEVADRRLLPGCEIEPIMCPHEMEERRQPCSPDEELQDHHEEKFEAGRLAHTAHRL